MYKKINPICDPTGFRAGDAVYAYENLDPKSEEYLKVMADAERIRSNIVKDVKSVLVVLASAGALQISRDRRSF